MTSTKIKIGINDLATTNPTLAKQWHPTKNGSLIPTDVSSGSHKKVWWICKEGHSWEAMISNRTRHNRGCPYCAHQRPIIGETDLATVDPELVLEWNYEKNIDIKPTDVTSGSNKVVWWKCKKCGHEWQSSIKIRHAFKTGCPKCPKTRTVEVTKGVNDFASKYPELARAWHPTRNGDLTPDNISYGSGKKVWWICKNGHEFQMAVNNKAKAQGCPICSRRRRTSFPEQAFYFYIKQVFPDAINSYKEIFQNGMELDIYIPSIKTGIEYDGKIFHQKLDNKLRDSKKYQICKEHEIMLIRIVDMWENSLITTSNRVIKIANESDEYLQSAIIELIYHLGKLPEADIDLKRDRLKILEYLESTDISLETEYPEIAKEFSKKRNGNLKASFFHPGSNERVWWECSDCGHEWLAQISMRTSEGNGCPKCATKKGAEKKKAFHLQHNGSLEETNPELMPFWNYEKNTVLPSEIIAGTTKKLWWICEKGHEWQSPGEHVSKRGLRCPYCLNKRILTGYNDLATIKPELLDDWDYGKNVDIDPHKIGAGTAKKVWWKCKKCGYEWETRVYSRSNGHGCPHCANLKKYGNQYARKNDKI